MPDPVTDPTLDPSIILPSIFTPGNNPNYNQQLRQRIALTLAARQRPFPKTLGEGLAAIGNALGDQGMMNSLLQQDMASRQAAVQQGTALIGGGATPTAATPPSAAAPSATGTAPTRSASLEPQDQNDLNAVDAGSATPHPVTDMIAKLESNRGADNASQPPTMVDPTYGQYGAFAKDYGGGEAGIHNFAQKTLAAKPDATVGDMYAGYVLGTGQPGRHTMADLQATAVPGAQGAYKNLVNNSPIDPNTPLSKFYGTPPTVATASPDTQDATLRSVTGMGGDTAPPTAYAATASAGPSADVPIGLQPPQPVGPGTRASIARTLMGPPTQTAPSTGPTIPGAIPPVPGGLQPPAPPDQGANASPDQRVAENIVSPSQSPTVVSDVRPAPVAPSQAQPAKQPGDPGYILTLGPQPRPPGVAPVRPEELKIQQALAQSANPELLMPVVKPALDFYANERAQRQAVINENYKNDMADWYKQKELQRTQTETQAKRVLEYQTGQQALAKGAIQLGPEAVSAEIEQRTGQKPEALITQLDTVDKPIAQKADTIIRQSQLVADVLSHGVPIVGYGANRRLEGTKLKAYLLNSGSAEDLASRTEQLQAALQSMLSSGLENLQTGKSGVRLTPEAVNIARGTTAASPDATLGAIKAIVAENARVARRQLLDYETKVDTTLGRYPGMASARMFTTTPTAPAPTAADPRDFTKMMLDNRTNPQALADYDKRFGEGAAELEIARAQRRARRGGP